MRPSRSLPLVLAVLVFFALPTEASADTITFENFADSTTITTQINGLVFANATAIAAGISLNEFEFPPHSGSNVVFDDGGPMSISFLTPVTSFGGYFTYSTRLTLLAYDANDNLLTSITSAFSSNLALSGDPLSSPNELLVFSSNFSISRITITGDPSGGSFTLDDVTINSPSAVPEPSTILLFLTGSAALLRYRKKRSAKRGKADE